MASNSTTETAAAETSGSDQQAEISFTKAAFPNRCRVTSDVGEFSKVVTVQPENMDVTITFQLPAAYPSAIPEIIIRSESMTEENVTDVRQILRSKAKEMLGQQMIRLLIAEAETRLRALGLKPGKAVQVSGHKLPGRHQQKNRKQKIKPKSEDEIQDKKLPPMKTADDVVKRIIWDDALEKDDFIVGYFDRFRGLVEKCFSAFSWEDLASVDYDVLAVPKHRIQYFKYKNVKVWDKTKRIDNIFGSAEGTKTMDVIMKELQELDILGQTGADRIFHNNVKNDRSENDSNDEDNTSSDDTDDSDIEVIIGNSAAFISTDSVKGEHSQHICKAEASPYAKDEEETQNGYNVQRHNKLRPNYFLCIRVTNEEILNKIGKFQDDLIEKEPIFSECCIPGASLHVTISTLGLDTPEQVLQCIETLKKIKPSLESTVPTSNLRLLGVSHFFNRVIYAQIQHKKDFIEFCCLLKNSLQEAGVEIRDGYDFVPHMTIMKITRPVARSWGKKYIDPKLYSSHVETCFGEQKIDSIYLCSMGKERRDDGFYLTPLELHFKI